MEKRSAPVTRTTTETDITLTLTIDGSGQYAIDTPVPFLTHMLELFSRHGMFDLTIKATGDVAIDYHHTVEDIGICLGQALRNALGDKQDMTRYGEATIPMDEAAAHTCIDLGGRPFLTFDVPDMPQKVGDFDLELVAEFFQAFVNNSACNLHIRVLSGKNAHHIIEAVFKSFARALDNASRIDPRGGGIRSTKGTL
jgi:imidazoleglycerol-phosphate dehydratase